MSKSLILSVLMLLFLLITANCAGGAKLALPTPLPQSCKVDSDCTLAIRVDVCCSCPEVTSRERVKLTKGLELYIPGRNYGSLRPAVCGQVSCSACPLAPAGAVCTKEICQAPNTPEDILSACPECFPQAAQVAYQSNDLQRALDYCSRSSHDEQYLCYSGLFNAALLKENLSDGEYLCRNQLTNDVGECLRSLALKWAKSNDKVAISLCNELNPADARHFNCILQVAILVKERDKNRALEICSQLSIDEAESCRAQLAR